MDAFLRLPKVSTTLGPHEESIVEKMVPTGDTTLNKILKFHIGNFSTADFIQVLVAILLVYLLIKYFVENIRRILSKTTIDQGIIGFLISGLKGIIYILGTIIILEAFGVPVTQMMAVIGVLGLAISLSIQNFMSNVMSGFTILVAKPYVVGDYIEANNAEGEVLRIGLLYTELLSVDEKVVFVPNSAMSSNRLINHSKNNTRKIDTYIGINYESNLELAKQIITSILENDSRVHKTPKPLVRLRRFGSSSLDIIVRAQVDKEVYFDVIHDFNETLLREFNKSGVGLAYPQLDVHLKK